MRDVLHSTLIEPAFQSKQGQSHNTVFLPLAIILALVRFYAILFRYSVYLFRCISSRAPRFLSTSLYSIYRLFFRFHYSITGIWLGSQKSMLANGQLLVQITYRIVHCNLSTSSNSKSQFLQFSWSLLAFDALCSSSRLGMIESVTKKVCTS